MGFATITALACVAWLLVPGREVELFQRRHAILGKRQDVRRLDVLQMMNAGAGAVLLIRSAASVKSVVGYNPHLSEEPFVPLVHRVLPTQIADVVAVAVAYPFAPYREMYLEVENVDGTWLSMSPYMPDKPNISRETWQAMWVGIPPKQVDAKLLPLSLELQRSLGFR